MPRHAIVGESSRFCEYGLPEVGIVGAAKVERLFIVSVKHPEKPRLLSHYDTIEFATGIAIAGDVLFVACRHFGVELIDVTAPDKPVHLSTVRTGEAQSEIARGAWLYVGGCRVWLRVVTQQRPSNFLTIWVGRSPNGLATANHGRRGLAGCHTSIRT